MFLELGKRERGVPSGLPALGPMSGSVEQNRPQGGEDERELPPARPALPPPAHQPAPPPSAGILDRFISWIELRPVWSGGIALVLLVGLHVAFMNFAGAMNGVFVGDVAFFATADGLSDLLLLAMIAYCIVLPTFLARSGLTAFADSSGTLTCNDSEYDDHLATLAGANAVARLVFGGFWAAVLTPVFGNLMQASAVVPSANTGILTIWMYIRLALVFGMMGSCLAYVALLHYRLSAALAAHLRVDLFDMTAMAPLARHMRASILYLGVPLLLLGPILSRPDAATASAMLLGFGASICVIAAFGSAWGARKAIRQAKQLALGELHAYSREIWRRAYANGRFVEAVALPAMAAMLTIRNQIGRMSNWPGGWINVFRCIVWAAMPAASWFGPQAAAWLIQPFFF